MTNTAVKYRQLLSEARFTGAADTVQRGAVDLILRCVVQENINFVQVHVYIFPKINQALNPTIAPSTPPPCPRPTNLRNGPPDKLWICPRLIFPLSRNMCSTFQSLVISSQMHVLCIRNFDSEQWDSVISQVTTVSVSYCQSLFTIGDYRDYQ